MNLFHLAFGCYLYSAFTDFDKSFEKFLRATDSSPDLTISNHRNELIAWLNSWGCRQFSRDCHELASQEILAWHNKHKNDLPDQSKNLWDLTEQEFVSLGLAYETLLNCTASHRRKKENTYSITFGPTGASKILFAIRPRALIPWDVKIRHHLGFNGDQESYLAYHWQVKEMLEKLEKDCQEHGIIITDLPKLFGRPYSTTPKLIDEYYWVTISNNCLPPTSDTLLHWIKWDQN
jgi:hypothetical protein